MVPAGKFRPSGQHSGLFPLPQPGLIRRYTSKRMLDRGPAEVRRHLRKTKVKIKPGGILIYDGYGIIEPPTRKDIQIYRIDAMDAANEKGMAKTFNMIVLGGLLKLRPVVSIESVIKALRKTLPERHHHLIPMNEEAIRIGMEIIKPQ